MSLRFTEETFDVCLSQDRSSRFVKSSLIQTVDLLFCRVVVLDVLWDPLLTVVSFISSPLLHWFLKFIYTNFKYNIFPFSTYSFYTVLICIHIPMYTVYIFTYLIHIYMCVRVCRICMYILCLSVCIDVYLHVKVYVVNFTCRYRIFVTVSWSSIPWPLYKLVDWNKYSHFMICV